MGRHYTRLQASAAMIALARHDRRPARGHLRETMAAFGRTPAAATAGAEVWARMLVTRGLGR